MIPVFFTSDNNYAPLIPVAIASICLNTQEFVSFYVVDGGITEENKRKIESLKNDYQNFSIDFVTIDANLFEGFGVPEYLTMAAYYRFMLANMFPHIGKALYLDIDIVVRGDIAHLFNKDLENYEIVAVEDQGSNKLIEKCKQAMGLPKDARYFNNGVLLFDLNVWREKDLPSKFFSLEKEYRERLLCADQDVFNKCFYGKCKFLHEKYNSPVLREETVIRHYYGALKPWHIHPKLYDNPYEDYHEIKYFWDVAEKTPFYEELLAKTDINDIVKLKFDFLLKQKTKERNLQDVVHNGGAN